MKRVNNTIKLGIFVILSMGLSSAAMAEHHESNKLKAQFQTDEEAEVELYDSDAGVMYSGTLDRFVFHRRIENVAKESDDKHSELTQTK